MSMIDKKQFLDTYNMTEQDIIDAKISWDELEAIYSDYEKKEEQFRGLGKDFLDSYLYDIEKDRKSVV